MRHLAIAALAAALTGSALAQKGYWLTAGNSLQFARYDAGTTSVFKTSGGQDYPIAVSGDVRTAASGQFDDSDHGGQYDLNGNWTGTDYVDFVNNGFNFLAYDGTTDGSNNFAMNYGSEGGVWITDRDWTNSKKLFDLGGFGEFLGITYDVERGSLWVSGWNSGKVIEFDLAGNALNSWDSGIGGSITCLAMDYTDNTLWMGQQNNGGTFYQFDRAGNKIGSFTDGTLAAMNTLGGEFEVVPEPATMFALAVGLAAVARRKRK